MSEKIENNEKIKGVKFMSVLRWMIFTGLFLLAGAVIINYFVVKSSITQKEAIYHCPMHPTYTSNQPGECPICGMTLVLVEEKKKEIKVKKDAIGDSKWICPMCPDVISDKPGKCPKCGMNLVPVEKKDEEHKSMIKHESPDGLINVHLSPERIQLIGLKTEKAIRRELSKQISLYGFVEKNERKTLKVHLKIEGWVEKLYANAEGDFVKKGSALLKIYSQQLYQTEQEIVLLLKSYENKSSVPEIENLIKSAQRRLKLLGIPQSEIKRLENTKIAQQELIIPSPINGHIIKKNIFEGSFVMPQTELFEISDLSDVWVIVQVFENEIPHITKNQEVIFKADSINNKEFKGKIDFIYPVLEEGLRVVKARVIINNENFQLKPGMFGTVFINTDKKEGLSVNKSAIIDGGKTKYLFVAKGDGHFEPRKVTTGFYFDDYAEIINGVEEGESVVVSSHFLIDSESRLKASLRGFSEIKEKEQPLHKH